MNGHLTGRFGTVHQTNWDWRAAMNFIFAGAGSSMLTIAALTGGPASTSGPVVLIGLALVGLGLASVWAEIGRPWRALNVVLHPQTSWMTREALVAGLLGALAIAAIATGLRTLAVAMGLAGLLFVYCQGRILRAAKGIPAWREPSVVPLVVATGLTEGTSILSLLGLIPQHATALNLLAVLSILVAVRFVSWWQYRVRMAASDMLGITRSALSVVHPVIVVVGTIVPLLGAALAFALPNLVSACTVIAALAATAAGWHMKYTLITRAAHVQGYALSKVLRRGHPLGGHR